MTEPQNSLPQDSDLVDFLTRFASAMKKKGHSQQAQSEGLKMIFDMVLREVYRN